MNWKPIETAPKDGTIILGVHKRKSLFDAMGMCGEPVGDETYEVIKYVHTTKMVEQEQEGGLFKRVEVPAGAFFTSGKSMMGSYHESRCTHWTERPEIPSY